MWSRVPEERAVCVAEYRIYVDEIITFAQQRCVAE